MGIRGLSSFILSQSTPGRPFRRNKSASRRDAGPDIEILVVDGNSFLHYVASSEEVCKRDVHRLAQQACHLAAVLHSHFPTLHFIFDGPLPTWKFPTRLKRDTQKIHQITTLVESSTRHTWKINTPILSPLALLITVAALKKRGYTVTFAPSEADMCIAQTAANLAPKSAVLSNDSDFFILRVPWFIPLESLTIDEGGGLLQARAYTFTDIATALDIHPAALPLIGAFCGCDHISDVDSAYLFQTCTPSSAQQQVSSRISAASRILREMGRATQTANLKDSQAVVDNLIHSLGNITADMPRIKELLNVAVDGYQLCPLTPDSNNDDDPIAAMRSGRINHKLLEVILNMCFWCTPFIEDTARASAWLISRPIRQYTYSIVNHPSPPTPPTITEYIRRGPRITSEPISLFPLSSAPLSSLLLPSQHITKTPLNTRLSVFTAILSTPTTTTASSPALPPSFLPFVCCVRFMLSQLDAATLDAHTLMCLILGGLRSWTLWNTTHHQQSNSVNSLTDEPTAQQRSKPTRSTIHILAQLESVIFCSLLLAESLSLIIDEGNHNDNHEERKGKDSTRSSSKPSKPSNKTTGGFERHWFWSCFNYLILEETLTHAQTKAHTWVSFATTTTTTTLSLSLANTLTQLITSADLDTRLHPYTSFSDWLHHQKQGGSKKKRRRGGGENKMGSPSK
ncbi:hypothetical protein HK102_013359, partial [Quaeritorhiza haematococci]